jgi:hypothetical protein
MSAMGSNMESDLFLSDSSKDGEWQTVNKGKHTHNEATNGSSGIDKAPKGAPITDAKRIRANQKETNFQQNVECASLADKIKEKDGSRKLRTVTISLPFEATPFKRQEFAKHLKDIGSRGLFRGMRAHK